MKSSGRIRDEFAVRRLVDGELTGPEREQLDQAAAADPELRAMIDAEERLCAELRLLGRLGTEDPAERAPGLVERLTLRAMEDAERERERPLGRLRWLARPRQLRLRVTPGVVALAAASLLLVVLSSHRLGELGAAQGAPSGASPLAAGVAPPASGQAGSPRAGSGGAPAVALASAASVEEAPGAGEPPRFAGASAGLPRPPGSTDVDEAGGGAELLEGLLVPVRFVLPAVGARTVSVVGDFNGWDAVADVLRDDDGDGVFVSTLELRPGSYAYMFVLDGEEWVADPNAPNSRDDGFGSRNSVLRID